ncbi:MAG: hypothetical protein AAGI15_12210 [Pseudomonadota bacterium]
MKDRADTRARQFAAASDDPSLIWVWTRRALLRMWRVRGGGFYGLGFVVTFVVLQIASIVGDAAEASTAMDFVTSQLVEGVLRFLSDTFINFLLSFLWPALFLDWIGSWGIVVLIAAFIAFDRWAKPWINAAAELEEAAESTAPDGVLVQAPPPEGVENNTAEEP